MTIGAATGEPKPSSAASPSTTAHPSSFWGLLLGSIGVVYGDIGTSPLYAFKESIAHVGVLDDGMAATRGEVIGVISLIFWALMIIVTLKYVLLLMRLDNRGEGGTLALMALAQKALGRRTPYIVAMGMCGAALFYGDAILTPAVSVLSAVEGLREVPGLGGAEIAGGRAPGPIDPFILPIAAGILIGLFAWQSRGTGKIGALFGPICLVWFLVLGGLGLMHLADDPGIFLALNPVHAVGFMVQHGGIGFVVLGSVFLAVTGAEALYADMGHFGRKPINAAWVWLILPCLMLNYFGQGAMVLKDPSAMSNPFFRMAPNSEAVRLGLVVLATAATVIASQAVITGAFSLTQQAIQLGLLPRLEIRHTSSSHMGQIYMPQINWLLMIGVLVLDFGFKTSSNLTEAYGVSVIGAMITSSALAFVAIWRLWKWPLWRVTALVAPFILIELVFLASNLLKLFDGGWIPLSLALCLMVLMWTWVRGSSLLAEQTKRNEPLEKLFETLAQKPPYKVPGTAIFLTADSTAAPAALMHNLKHNKVLHEKIIILTVRTIQSPRVDDAERVTIAPVTDGVSRVTLTFGFMETPNVVKALSCPAARSQGVKLEVMKTSFFLSRRTVLPSAQSGMPLWQDHLFIFLTRNATNATDFFHIPSGRAVELGNQVIV
jgi:KUP system potassium uptake protein